MAKPSSTLFEGLQRRLIRLDQTRRRVEKLHLSNQISSFDVEQIYSGLFIAAFVSFERYIEELFVGYLTGQVTLPRKHGKSKVGFSNTPIAIQVLLSGKKYLDWVPYQLTKDRAQVYFADGKPFSNLEVAEERTLDDLHRIRNALAHRSDHAQDVFSRLVIGSLPLGPREKFPARFLRSAFRANPYQTRFENYFFEILAISKKLSV